MNKKMLKIAKEIDNLWGKYIDEYRKHTGDTLSNCVYIKYENGEINVSALSVKELKKYVKFMKED